MSTIAGIDLGTTFSALARLNGIGRPEIVPNSEGERITPSAVYFEEDEAGANGSRAHTYCAGVGRRGLADVAGG